MLSLLAGLRRERQGERRKRQPARSRRQTVRASGRQTGRKRPSRPGTSPAPVYGGTTRASVSLLKSTSGSRRREVKVTRDAQAVGAERPNPVEQQKVLVAQHLPTNAPHGHDCQRLKRQDRRARAKHLDRVEGVVEQQARRGAGLLVRLGVGDEAWARRATRKPIRCQPLLCARRSIPEGAHRRACPCEVLRERRRARRLSCRGRLARRRSGRWRPSCRWPSALPARQGRQRFWSSEREGHVGIPRTHYVLSHCCCWRTAADTEQREAAGRARSRRQQQAADGRRGR